MNQHRIFKRNLQSRGWPFGLLVLFLLSMAFLALGQSADAATAAITLSKKAGPPTSSVVVSGSGFGASESIAVNFDTTSVGSSSTDPSGVFSTTVTVPASALPGTHTFTAKGGTSSLSATANFIVRTNWTEFGFTPAHSGLNPFENVLGTGNLAGLPLKWNALTGNKVISSPAVANGVVFFGSNDNKLYAFNIGTHALRWSATTGGAITSSPAVGGSNVIVGSGDGKVYAYSTSTGALVWSVTTGGPVTGSPAMIGGTVYIGSQDGKLYALNASTGAQLWATSVGGPIKTSPALSSSTAFVVVNGFLKAYKLLDGSFLWSYSSLFVNSPALYKTTVIVGGSNGAVAAFSATKGTILWAKGTGAAVNSTAAIDGAKGMVFIGSGNKNLYAFSISTGAILWTATTGGAVNSSPAVANGVVYVGSMDGKLYAYNEANGALLWSYATGSPVESSTAVADGQVYVGSDNFKLYVFGR